MSAASLSSAPQPGQSRANAIVRVREWFRSDRSEKFRGPRGVCAVYAISRLAMLLIPFGILPWASGTLIPNDVTLYASWAQVIEAGHFPVNDPMWQYPPLAGFVFWLGAHLTSSPILGFMVLALIVDAIVFFTLLRLGMKDDLIDGAWTYAIGGILIGPVLLTRFDLFPTLFAVLGLVLLSRPIRSGIMFGVGALLKVWPAFLVVALPRRSFAKATAAVIATVIVGMTAISMYGFGAFSFLKEQGDRGLQIESVGGLVYVSGKFLGLDTETTFRYGSMEIAATGAGAIASIVTLVGFIAMGAIVYLRLRGRLEHVLGADVALVMVLVSIASSRVFSPQYMVWVIGIAAVCMLYRSTQMRPVIYLCLACAFFGELVYPLAYGTMVHGGWIGVLLQTIRIALLLAATVWGFYRLLKPAPVEPLPLRAWIPWRRTANAPVDRQAPELT